VSGQAFFYGGLYEVKLFSLLGGTMASSKDSLLRDLKAKIKECLGELQTGIASLHANPSRHRTSRRSSG
jgi:hypothetical protein